MKTRKKKRKKSRKMFLDLGRWTVTGVRREVRGKRRERSYSATWGMGPSNENSQRGERREERGLERILVRLRFYGKKDEEGASGKG